MSNSSRLSPLFVMKQLQIQRQNLASVCRLAVKSLIERSGLGIIDDSSKELDNCINILEHIFNHRLKPVSTWYGGQEPRCFWDYIRVACQRVPHNCLASVEALELPQTPLGKGRAWIRMCLMEKRLADYISIAVQQIKTTEHYYDEGSLMLSDDVHMLADLLLGLNCIDFSLDVKGIYLDYPATPAVDFTPFLRYDNRDGSSYPPIMTAEVDSANTVDSEQLGTEFWKTKYKKLEEQFKITNDQKNYAEEMFRLRESQLAEVHSQRQRLMESLEYLQNEKKKDESQFESVVIELQSQLVHLMEENSLLVRKMQSSSRQRNRDSITMSDLLNAEAQRSKADDGSFTNTIVVEMHSTPGRISDVRASRDHSKQTTAADCLSVDSEMSNMSTLPTSGNSQMYDDTASTAVFAGSISSGLNAIPDSASAASGAIQ